MGKRRAYMRHYEQVKKLVEAGQMLEAQKLIIAEIVKENKRRDKKRDKTKRRS